jgi:hypothetical protein
MSDDSSDDFKFLCTEINNNRRHYSNLRFAIFSVYFAVLGGVSSISFGLIEIKSSNPINPIGIIFWARLGGLLFTLVFFWFEILCALNLLHYQRIAKELPQMYRKATIWERRRFLWAFYATWSLYAALVLFWVVALCRSSA